MLVRTSCVSFAYPQRAGEKLIHYTVLPLHKKARQVARLICKRIRTCLVAYHLFVGKGILEVSLSFFLSFCSLLTLLSLFSLIPSHNKSNNREKLGTKAVREEFHGLRNAENVITALKQLYGWGIISANVWLPSMSELVGYNPNTYNATNGCYYSAMQGLNLSGNAWTDAQGGSQFVWFKQHNASGGGEKIWNACKQEQSWLRSPDLNVSNRSWRTTNAERFDVLVCSASHAVHPAVR